jgi:hypothetical protein
MADSSSTSIDTADVLAVDATVQRATDSAGFGITQAGFVPKPFARLLAEKLALAQQLLGDDIDLTSGSVLRRILEGIGPGGRPDVGRPGHHIRQLFRQLGGW